MHFENARNSESFGSSEKTHIENMNAFRAHRNVQAAVSLVHANFCFDLVILVIMVISAFYRKKQEEAH